MRHAWTYLSSLSYKWLLKKLMTLIYIKTNTHTQTYLFVYLYVLRSYLLECAIYVCRLLFASHPYLSPGHQLGAPDVSTFLSNVAIGIPFVPMKPENFVFENLNFKNLTYTKIQSMWRLCLQRSFTSCCSLVKNIQNEGCAITHSDISTKCFF